MSQRTHFISALSAALVFSLACAQEAPTDQATDPSTEPQADQTDQTASTPPADTPFKPLSSRDGSAPETVASDQQIVAPGVMFTLPTTWQREAPSSSMRLAQAQIPGEDGPGQLTVFFFGEGGGGGVEANLERWMAQIEPDSNATPIRDGWSSGAFKVTWIDTAGTLLPSTMGMGPSTPQPGSRLLAAVVEGPGGPWFFKATGPAATLAAARQDFIGMLRSVEAHG